MDVSKLAKQVTKLVLDNAPAILTTIGSLGVLTTAVLAVKAGMDTTKDIQVAKERKGEELTKTEVVVAVWTNYVPVVVSGTLAVACIIGAHSVNAKRQAALIGMYTLLEGNFQEYKEKAKELTTGQKEIKIRDTLAQEKVDANPVSSKEVVISDKGGNVLCYDTLSGRYFESDMETLRRAQNDINEILLKDDYASQNDFYDRIGLPSNGYGSEFGWTTDVMLELQFSTVMSDDNRPCISIDYRMLPIRGYHKFG